MVRQKRGKKIALRRQLRRYGVPLAGIIFLHQELEATLDETIAMMVSGANLLDSDMRLTRMALYPISTTKARIDLFSQIANDRFRDARTRKRINAIYKELLYINRERNNIIHGRWAGVPRKEIELERPNITAPTFTVQTHTYTPRRLIEIDRRALRVIKRLYAFGDFTDAANKRAMLQELQRLSQHATSHGKP